MKGNKYTNTAGVACGVFVAIMLVANAIAGSGGGQAGAKTSDIPADAVTVTGTAPGMMGDVTVEVTATPEKLYQIKVTEQNETPEIGGLAVAQLPGDIYDAQSLDVDGVTGATVTSNAIKNAIRNGLDSAGISTAAFESGSGEDAAPADGVTKGGVEVDETEENATEPEEAAEGATETDAAATETDTGTTEPDDGASEADENAEEIPADAVTATGTAKGINGDVTVEVTATPDKLYRVKVVEQSETEGIGSLAVAQLPGDILNAQSLQVDGVTGATVTSEAIKNAIRNALEGAGVAVAAFEAAPVAVETEKEPDVTYETDVVIIGAGGAGMTAAVVAADAGRNVIIVESMPMVGGNSIRSTGGMNAAKTVYQDANEFAEEAGVEKQLETAKGEEYADNEAIQELAATVEEQWKAYQDNSEGYFDSEELFQLDTLIGGHGINDPALVKKLTEESAGAIDWLHSIGADLQSVSSFGGASVKRIHRPVDASGKTVSVGEYLVPILQENLNKRENITLYLNTKAVEILKDDSGVTGIVAEGPTGNKITVNAKAVIDTAGGFGANHEKVVSYRADLDGFTTTNASGIQGQGIDMAVAIGAATVDMEQIQIHPTVEYNTSNLITEGLRGDGAILVNADGYRFYDEVSTRDKVSAAEIEQPGSFSWLIIDSKMVENSNVIQGYIKKGYTVTGDTYEELADAMGVPAETFRDTMEFWNSCAANKTDPIYGRTSFAQPLDLAPFYAIKVTAGIHHTMGGLKINPDAEVFDTSGNVIPGLYAAGEVTGGVHGGNRLGGNAVADFVVFGCIAGTNAAEFAGQ